MDTRIDNDVEATTEEQRIETPAPEWLEAGFEKLFPPPGENTEPGFIVRSLWTAHQSVPQVLVRLPLALAQSIYFHAIEAFYWKTALLQACIMFIFFADMLTRGMLLVMGLTYAFLLLRDGYSNRKTCSNGTSFCCSSRRSCFWHSRFFSDGCYRTGTYPQG